KKEPQFSITSIEPTPLNYRIYPSYNDYIDNKNWIAAGIIKDHERVDFRMADFNKDSLYYVELFSDDFAVSNWHEVWNLNNESSLYLRPKDHDYQPWIAQRTGTHGRLLFDDKTKQTWTAVDAYKWDKSIWDDLSVREQFLKLTFFRNHSIIIQYISANGASLADTVQLYHDSFSLPGVLTGNIVFYRDTSEAGYITGYYSTDTITIRSQNNYIMVKER